MTERARQLADLGMRQTHAKDALLRAVLTETADLSSHNHWTLREKLQRLRDLAVRIHNTGTPDLAAGHPTRGVSILDWTDDDDYGAPNTHLPTEED